MKFNSATWGAVLWPAFLGAALADAVLFTLIDPETRSVRVIDATDDLYPLPHCPHTATMSSRLPRS